MTSGFAPSKLEVLLLSVYDSTFSLAGLNSVQAQRMKSFLFFEAELDLW